MAQIVNLAANTAVYSVASPFQPGQPVQALIGTTGVLKAVNHPGTNPLRMGQGIDNSVSDEQKVLRISLDGVTTVFDEDDYPALANAHVDDAGINIANRLRVVVRELGVGQRHVRLLNRVAASATPTDGQFKTSEVSAKVTLTLGDAGAEGLDIEVWILDADDIEGTVLTAGIPREVDTRAVCVTDQDCALVRLVGGGS